MRGNCFWNLKLLCFLAPFTKKLLILLNPFNGLSDKVVVKVKVQRYNSWEDFSAPVIFLSLILV